MDARAKDTLMWIFFTFHREEVFGLMAPLLQFKTEEAAFIISNKINAGISLIFFSSDGNQNIKLRTKYTSQ